MTLSQLIQQFRQLVMEHPEAANMPLHIVTEEGDQYGTWPVYRKDTAVHFTGETVEIRVGD